MSAIAATALLKILQTIHSFLIHSGNTVYKASEKDASYTSTLYASALSKRTQTLYFAPAYNIV